MACTAGILTRHPPVVAYDTLADVYDWLVPDALLEPEGAAAAFAELDLGRRVLDCAAGTGTVAVGLALRGHEVVATDASAGMIERARALARQHGVDVEARVCAWEQLGDQGFDAPFDAVLCVGNSLTHAEGAAGRRAALLAMADVTRPGGLVAVTSRAWEQPRRGLEVDERLVERHGMAGVVIRFWEGERHLHVAVALLDPDGGVRTVSERLEYWPFTHTELDEDLRAAGLEPESSTWAPEAGRYLVTARRA
jgi:SAM-dependent methyltransferase